jgi:hypothetical protein
MIKIGEEYYFLDLEKIADIVVNDESLKAGTKTNITKEYLVNETKINSDIKVTEEIYDKPLEYNQPMYNTISYMIEILNSTAEDDDMSIGFENWLSKKSFGYKLAYNTLIKLEILKKI